MKNVIYSTDNGIFEFLKSDVLERLRYHKTEKNSLAASVIEKYITDFGQYPTIIPREYDYFVDIIMEMIGNGGGSVTCKVCNKTYKYSELKSIEIGHGKTPFSDQFQEIQGLKDLLRMKWIKIAIGNAKNLFRRKRRMPPLFGGEGFECPEGHELISVVTWRT